MSIGDPVTNPSGLVARVKAILLSPRTEWPVIDAEPATVGGLYRNYIVWLAAIGPVCTLIGQLLMPVRVMGYTFVFTPGYLIGQAVLSYILTLGGVYVVALIVDALAPTFNGVKNRVSALKVVAYSYTAAWVAGVFGLIPVLGVLVFLAMIYGFYLLYLGLPVLMKCPADKSAVYVVVTIVAAIVVYMVIGAIVAALMASFVGPIVPGVSI